MRGTPLLAALLFASPVFGQTTPNATPPPNATTPAPGTATPPPEPKPEERIRELEQSQTQLQEQVQSLQQELSDQQQENIQQQESMVQGLQAIQELQQFRNQGESFEQTRVQRAVSYDAVEQQITELEAAMALGRTIDDRVFLELQQNLAALQANIQQQSGREELIYLTSALYSLDNVRRNILGGDYFTARQFMFEVIDNIVAARNSNTGNPMPAWRPTE